MLLRRETCSTTKRSSVFLYMCSEYPLIENIFQCRNCRNLDADFQCVIYLMLFGFRKEFLLFLLPEFSFQEEMTFVRLTYRSPNRNMRLEQDKIVNSQPLKLGQNVERCYLTYVCLLLSLISTTALRM